ncbi:methionyl-tRNA formyltransferase [Spirulina sp. 06S082]|uniref:methionyl-tRNA formyltransferase n=1 Tax=Spirulina sp. 06S082 TaxID=3110248 RepID=UPI002B1EDC33|nr:methionyl-tRNA formyltransferase [Spirulina sp. 06S082]MEA5471365.1 methionyl-tRNA formyltransferase [Spirulina sp. 06S082]
MKIVFFGTPQFAVPSLQRLLLEPEIEVLGVVTQPDRPRGRGKKLLPSAIKKVALEHQVPIWQPRHIKKAKKTLNLLRETGADAFIVVAYGQLLSQEILDLPRLGCINGHGSLLPQYRGAAPLQWCLYNGETETGMTTMLMDIGMDTGAMLLQSSVAIAFLDNALQLAITLSENCADLLVKTLFKLQAGEITPIPQDNNLATYAPLIQKSDYILDWNRPAIALHNQIRAFYPYCVAQFRDKPLKILATIPVGEEWRSQLPPEIQQRLQSLANLSSMTGQPGEIVGFVKKLGAIVQTGAGLLLLQEVQLSGKRPQSGWDFVNGTRLTIGERVN